MSEEQEILNKKIGIKESTKLKPTKVKIVKVTTEKKPEWKSSKVVCEVKHPDKEDTILISSVKYENKGKLESIGLWANLDEDNLLRKGSALAVLLNFLKVEVSSELEGKEIDTSEDEKGYLCFKAY